MASAKRARRVAAGQDGFLSLKKNSSIGASDLIGGRRKRVNKNKKKSWNKHSDVQDVEEFLDDVRLQERTTGGLISEKSDDSLFFVDTGVQKKPVQTVTEVKVGRRGRASRPLRIDLILQHDSLVPPPKDVLAHQKPNAKKLRRIAQSTEKLAAKGVFSRRQKRLLNIRPATETLPRKQPTVANNHPERPYYDLWGAEVKETRDPWFLEQTGKKLVKRPDKLNEKASVLPAVEVIAPGGSYNPDFFSHQALLQEAHDVELKKQKAELRIERQLAVKREDTATEESKFQEQVEGLVEEEEEEEKEEEEDDVALGVCLQQEKKTEKQRRKERAEKIKEQQKQTERTVTDKRQQLFQLRSIHASLKRRDQLTRERQVKRKAKQEAQKALPRRLGRLKFQAADLEVQLSDEIPGSLRTLKPEGSILKDRFKSLQKRNMIEPRERAKFVRRHKLKYVEKRAFKAIT